MRFQPFGQTGGEPWEGIQAWRAEFDSLLLDRARAEGVAIHQPVEVLRPRWVGNRVVGVDTTRGTCIARWVIDASGADGILQRALRLHVVRREPTVIVRYGYAHGRLAELLDGDGAPRLAGSGGRWTWMAQVRPDVIHWCCGAVDGIRVQQGPPPALTACRPSGLARGAETTCRIVVECAGRGYFLAGDAAAVVDPISSHGVLRALLGGMHLGTLIARVAHGLIDEREAGLAYVRVVQTGFEDDAASVRRFYDMLAPWRPT
jgi:flavin-dependent dehydrogenase